MIHKDGQADRARKLGALLQALNEKGQDQALRILRSLKSAQSAGDVPESRQGRYYQNNS